jgi:hypothetical protein
MNPVKCCLVLVGIALPLVGCSRKPEPIVQYYYPATKQLPMEPVYSRLTWSHLPQPYPAPYRENSPKIQPVIKFELLNSKLEEAIQALSRTIGYRWDYPADVARRRVSIRMTGTAEEIATAIGREAGVHVEFDSAQRRIRVLESGNNLPPARTLPTRS